MRLAGEMLEMGADEYSRHGCNDYSFSHTVTRDEQVEIVYTGARLGIYGAEDIEQKIAALPDATDWVVMLILAAMLREHASR